MSKMPQVQTVGHRGPLRICSAAINASVILRNILLLRDLHGAFTGKQARLPLASHLLSHLEIHVLHDFQEYSATSKEKLTQLHL